MVDIDLDRHAVIEASAGTGKTYTLVDLAKVLLSATGASLENILLVTYTEKATGELKSRLRAALEEAVRHDGNAQRRLALQKALDTFDQAHVHTIHGFCQRVLQEFAFENRRDFHARMVRDGELWRPCLREIQRKTWRQEYGAQLPLLLELSGYGDPKQGGASWEETVLKVAEAYRPACDHRLVPEARADLAGALPRIENQLRDDLAEMRRRLGAVDPRNLTQHCWWVGFGKLDFRPDHRGPRQQKILWPLLQFLADPQADAHPLSAFWGLLCRCQNAGTFKKNGFALLIDLNEAEAQLPELCPGLKEVTAILERARNNVDWQMLENQLAVHTVRRLQEHVRAYKQERGLQSFEDLLTEVDRALDPSRNPQAGAILAGLRARYRYAVVDEFQDTDPIQWRIFRRIFVEGKGGQRLFVVGDPKQAIFGFRGADLHEYLKARKALKDDYGAAAHALDVNWRSCPELLVVFNQLFGTGQWFPVPEGMEDATIAYTPVHPPREEAERLYKIVKDRTCRAALTMVGLPATLALSRARKQMAEFIAGEIERLLALPAGRSNLIYQGKQREVCQLRAQDICVLAATRKEAVPLLEGLRRRRIPYTFYKQPGLWQSDEAAHLSYLLRALTRPGHAEAFAKALLTDFYRIPLVELSQCEELPHDHAVKTLFLDWCILVEKRRWSALFQSFLEKTGLLFHEPEAADPDRRRANYRQIFHTLEEAAYGRDLDLLGVLEFLDDKRRQPGDDDTGLQPVETDQPKVRIMTIHAAKGLEFPIVFLAGGFTQRRAPVFHTYRDPSGKLVFDLGAGDDAKQAYRQEREAEERRLYYVALTRAIFKLYVPLVLDAKITQVTGPIVNILAPAVEKAGMAKLGYPWSETVDFRGPAPDSSRLPADHSAPDPKPAQALAPAVKPPRVLFPAEHDDDLSRRRIFIHSFSSLHRRRAQRAVEGPIYVERPARAEDETPADLEAPDSLRGPVFGEMVHEILEAIDFEEVGRASTPDDLPVDARALIEEVRLRHWTKLPARLTGDPDQAEACRNELARLVHNGLHSKLDALGGPLWLVPRADRLHELEFLFPEQAGPPPSGPRRAENFLTGIMDLVFRAAGKFFLADWKTNLLAAGYTPDALAQSMEECDYIRQYRLYLQALARWLNRVQGDRFNFKRDFGGVYYLFLRGMNGQDQNTGVFFHAPNAEDLRLQNVLEDCS